MNFGGQFLLPLYFRDVCHEALADVGLLLTPQLIGSAIGFPVAGYFSDRLGPRVVLIVGGLISVLATWPLAMIDGGSSYLLVGSALAIRGFGLALATVPAMAGAALVTACYVRLAHTQGSLAAFQHAGWILISGAILLTLSALFMVNHQGSSTREETR